MQGYGRFREHSVVSRRRFLELGSAAVGVLNVSPRFTGAAESDPLLEEAVAKLEYLTPMDRIRVLDKGKAGVGKLSSEKLAQIGLTPETWALEVIPDPTSNCVVERSLSRTNGSALGWTGLTGAGVLIFRACPP